VHDQALISKISYPEGRYFLTLASVEKRKNLQTSISCFREILKQPGCEDLFFELALVFALAMR